MKEIKMQQWICYNQKFDSHNHVSLAWTRKDSIAKLIEGTSYDWTHWRKNVGWTCIKVTVTITPIN